jgi:hypothetical protein
MKSYWVEAGDMLMHRHHKDMIEVRLFSEVRKEIELRKRWLIYQLLKVHTAFLWEEEVDVINKAFTKPITKIEKELGTQTLSKEMKGC